MTGKNLTDRKKKRKETGGVQIRRILVPLVGSENDRLGLDLGFGLARDLKAHADALFVRPDPEDAIPYLGYGDGKLEDFRDDFRRHAEHTGQKAAAKSHRQFNAACKRHGIGKVRQPGKQHGVSARWLEVVGRGTHEIPEFAKLCDLTVFAGALTDYHQLLPNVLERTLLESGRPLLFVPRGSMGFPPQRVAIACDASVQAVRAVFGAEVFLQNAKRLQVFSVEERYEDAVDPQKLIEYLAWHGLNGQGKVIVGSDKNVGQVLLDEAVEIGADLLIMGGYAHTRFQEVVFRGTTLHALRNTGIPLLMKH